MIGRLALIALALAAAKDDPLAGRVAGQPVNCVDIQLTQGPEIRAAHTILYRETGRRIWRTEPIGTCPGLQPVSTLIVEMYGAQLCRNDRFRVQRPGETIPGPVCRFGAFTPYDKPPRLRH